jgi:8-oxo-dGTP diphosphatase
MEYNETAIRSRYQLVPRTLVFIRDGDRYLFIHKKKKDSFGFEKLNAIGGHIEKGEEPYESARREVEEETGLLVADLSLCAVVFIEIGINPGILLFVFSANYSGGVLRDSEEGNLVWLEKKEVENGENIVKDVPFLLEIIREHHQGAPPVFIKYFYNEKKELRIVNHSSFDRKSTT